MYCYVLLKEKQTTVPSWNDTGVVPRVVFGSFFVWLALKCPQRSRLASAFCSLVLCFLSGITAMVEKSCGCAKGVAVFSKFETLDW